MRTQYDAAMSLDGFLATLDDSLRGIVQVGSVVLGRGKPWFPRTVVSPPLRLMSVRQFGPGMAELRYERPLTDGQRS
jgi:hypothetical protein